MHKTPLVIVLLLVATSSAADCLDPLIEPVTRTESGAMVNSHPESTSLCVNRVTRYCKECEPGYIHECKDSRWRANKKLECGDPRRVEPSSTNKQSEEVSEAAVALHGAIVACGGDADLDAVHRNLAYLDDPMWTGPPPTTVADALKLTTADHDKKREELEYCREGSYQNCSYLEERASQSGCLVREITNSN